MTHISELIKKKVPNKNGKIVLDTLITMYLFSCEKHVSSGDRNKMCKFWRSTALAARNVGGLHSK
jgi:hypothetical protein